MSPLVPSSDINNAQETKNIRSGAERAPEKLVSKVISHKTKQCTFNSSKQ